MLAVDVAHGYQSARLAARKVVLAEADASHADDTLGQLVVGGYVARASEHAARNDGEQRHAAQSL